MKQVLYIGGKYISTIAELKDLLQNGRVQLIKDEIVAAQKDGTLSEWILSQNLELWEKELKTREKQFADNDTASEDTERITREEVKNIKDKIDEIRDEFTNDICKSVYKVITGENLSIDLSSDFSQIASLISCDIEGQKYHNNNGNIDIVSDNKRKSKMVLHFESLKDNSDELVFALKQDNSKSAKKSRTRKNYKVGETFSVEFDISVFNAFSPLILEDGKGNCICQIHMPESIHVHWSSSAEKEFKAMSGEYAGCCCALIDSRFYNKIVRRKIQNLSVNNVGGMIQTLNDKVLSPKVHMEIANREQLEAAPQLKQVENGTNFIVKDKKTVKILSYQKGESAEKKFRSISSNSCAVYLPVVVKNLIK